MDPQNMVLRLFLNHSESLGEQSGGLSEAGCVLHNGVVIILRGNIPVQHSFGAVTQPLQGIRKSVAALSDLTVGILPRPQGDW